MSKIEKLIKEYEVVKEESRKKQGYSAQQEKKDELKEFYAALENYANQTKGYVREVKIELDLINGANKYEKFVLTLVPNNLETDKDSVLFGYWKNDAVDGTYSCYSFNPNYEHVSRVDETNGEKKFYIPALTFVFLQLYGQKEYLYGLVEDKIVEDLKKKIEVEKKLNEIVTNI